MKKKPRGPKKGPVGYGVSRTSKKKKNGRRKMTSEPRTVEISVDNYHAAIETFLRSMKAISNDEDVSLSIDWDTPRHGNTVLIKLTPKEVELPVDRTVH